LADIESRKIATLLHTGLVAVDLEGNIYPRLAESWAKRNDSTWVFKIKPNVQFSDGTAANAEAVVKSLCWSMQPSHLYSWALASISHKLLDDGTVQCTGISAENEQTVVIQESKPVPWFLESLDSPAGWIIANPGEKPAAWGARHGVGPFQLGRINTDHDIELEARNNGAVAPKVENILFKSVSDPLAATRMFQQGDLDMLRVENPDMLILLKQANATLIKHKFQRFRMVIFSREALKKKGFNHEQTQNFITAYSAFVNRKKIAELSHGLGSPMTTAFPPATDIIISSLNASPSNLDSLPKATLTLLTINDAYSDLIASHLPTEIGKIKINYRTVESSLLINSLFKGEADLISMLIDATSSSPTFWSSFWTPGSSFVVFGTPLSEFTELDFINDADIEVAAQVVDQKGNWVGVLKETGFLALSPKLHGLRLTPSGQVSLEGVSLEKD
jgi:ABC-type transport system substrate-binding protein